MMGICLAVCLALLNLLCWNCMFCLLCWNKYTTTIPLNWWRQISLYFPSALPLPFVSPPHFPFLSFFFFTPFLSRCVRSGCSYGLGECSSFPSGTSPGTKQRQFASTLPLPGTAAGYNRSTFVCIQRNQAGAKDQSSLEGLCCCCRHRCRCD